MGEACGLVSGGLSGENKARVNVLGVGISSLHMDEAVETLLDARRSGQSGYVCVTGVHGVIESQRDAELRTIHNSSFLTVPDGMPTVWMGREQGFTKMGRVYGPDLMLRLCEATASEGNQALRTKPQTVEEPSSQHLCPVALAKEEPSSNGLSTDGESHYRYPSQDETGSLDVGHFPPTNNHRSPNDKKCLTHFLYGATAETLQKLKRNLEVRFPGVRVVGTYAPPFRPMNEKEEAELSALVSDSKPDFFWVGLSTPKQEKFMAAHTDNPDFGIMLGVGAAFPIHAGLQKDAPEWIKNSGLQWLHRLCQEPRRLWRRYLDIVPTFLWFTVLQLLGVKKFTLEPNDAGNGGY